MTSVRKVGAEFLVNTNLLWDQSVPQITALTNGKFVVIWQDGIPGAPGFPYADTSGLAVKAQVFDATGAKVGGEIRVNSATVNDQYAAQVTSLSNGGFVVTWQDSSHAQGGASGDPDGLAVKAQVFDPNGNKIGGELLVNTNWIWDQSVPQITSLSNGGFVVTWQDGIQNSYLFPYADGSGLAVKAQVFSATGAKVGGEIRVNSATANDQY